MAALLAATALCAGPLAAQVPTAEDATESLRLRVERLRSAGTIEVAGDTVAAGSVAAFYEARGFQPAWRDSSRVRAVIDAISTADADGLDPADYHLRALRDLDAVGLRSPADTAARDLVLTSAVFRLAHDLRRGRADRSLLNASWSVTDGGRPVDAAALDLIIDAPDISVSLDSLAPRHPIYVGMREALARYRAIEAGGGWPVVPAGPTMRRDSVAGPIALLRRRLALEGYIEMPADGGEPVFDEALESAVVAFQHTHGLNEDGLVGPATRAELNLPVERRIDALLVNMERARWVLPGLADRFVAANIAGQKVYFVDNGTVTFETRAVVGTSYTRTPVFSGTMRYIVINPTWTVPRSINDEILAGVRDDPAYLASRDIVVIDADEKRVDPASIDFAAWTGETFPWVFRQMAGPLNPLGRIKFMFPNRYDIYLHDTPARAEFDLEERAFSHGCIRVEDPFRLAELVLAGQEGGEQATLLNVVASGATRTIQLERPVPVLLLYWTAASDLHGELHFYRDVYDRDAAVLRALEAPARR